MELSLTENNDLPIPEFVFVQLMAEARCAHPRECCGILLGDGMRINALQPAANVHPSPETHFEIDPQALINAHRAAREGGAEVLGYYHSHPSGSAKPSQTDRAMAAGDGKVWAIVAQEGIRFWQDLPGGFVPLPYEVIES